VGDFRDQLLKAGLVTAEAAAAATARQDDARPRGDARGGEGRGGEGRGRRGGGQGDRGGRSHGEARPGIDEAAALERERQRVARGAEVGRRQEQEALELARKGRLELRGSGQQRWYFASRRGALPWLDVPDPVAQRLTDGRAAIVEAPSGQPLVVDSDTAGRLEVLDSRWIRLWNRRR
jgi:uncharacterized protein YaiL (DUF2058 family)